MECNKWEEAGLLYSSNELDSTQRFEYESHLKECEYCSTELKSYLREKEKFYSGSVLEEAPSSVTDQEIIRVCSKSAKMNTSFNIFSALFRKAAVSTSLLVLGFMGMGYFVYVMQNTQQEQMLANEKNENQKENVAESPQPETSQSSQLATNENADKNDSVSSNDSIPFADRLGNTRKPGITTVDLNDK